MIMFELDVLGGPMALRWNDQSVRLRPMERTVILSLLCAKGHTLSTAKLVSQLWDDGPRDGATRTLASHVAHIRSALRAAAGDDGLLVSDSVRGGVDYRLTIDPECVDSFRLERQVAVGCRMFEQGMLENAVTVLDAALALWRGVPLADVGDWPFARPEITRLTNLYRTAGITGMEARMALGRHREAIGRLEDMADEWPGDSRVWQLLVVSLHHSHRDDEASAACARAITAFRDRGLDVGRLQKLQYDVLNGLLPH